jgi:hypothetical protein
MEYEIKLDIVLKHFLTNEFINENISNFDKANVLVSALKLHDYDELIELLEILREDKHILFSHSNLGNKPNLMETTTTIDSVKITTKGRIFISRGGYTKELAIREAENQRIVHLELYNARVSFWLAVGGVGLLLFEILKWVIPNPCCLIN